MNHFRSCVRIVQRFRPDSDDEREDEFDERFDDDWRRRGPTAEEVPPIDVAADVVGSKCSLGAGRSHVRRICFRVGIIELEKQVTVEEEEEEDVLLVVEVEGTTDEDTSVVGLEDTAAVEQEEDEGD